MLELDLMDLLVCKCCESDVCLFQGDVGQRGPPGIPGDVSKTILRVLWQEMQHLA